METPNSVTVCALALKGVGVGLANPTATNGFAERGLLLRAFEPAVYFKTYLLFRPDTQKAALVKAPTAELLRARGRQDSRTSVLQGFMTCSGSALPAA